VFRCCALERDHLAAQIYFWGGDEHGYTDFAPLEPAAA
jgi:hypothetical protein